MSEVEQLAQEQFNTFKNRLCEILSEIEEEHKSAFMYGYAQGETDEKFRTKQVVTKENAELKEQIKIDTEHIRALQKQNGELTDKVRKLKILVSSLVYEINQIWDINEMNDDLRICAEKIDREVQLSKMAEDKRMVISALGFAIVPPKPKLDVKEI